MKFRNIALRARTLPPVRRITGPDGFSFESVSGLQRVFILLRNAGERQTKVDDFRGKSWIRTRVGCWTGAQRAAPLQV